jgi:3D (Asp-Asp-Asp) domain-containing protein
MRRAIIMLATLLVTLTSNFAQDTKKDRHKKTFIYTEMMKVTASAYCSIPKETDDTPFLAAWGNILKPSVKSIAISRDLFDFGLTNGKRVHIDGIEGEFIVLDVMHKKWKNKIDIYMGLDRKKALKFGRKKVTIRWEL